MSERAEGFWWVRWGAEWEVVKVEQRYDVPRMLQVRFSGVEEASDLAYAERYEIREWGPYLGKEPGRAMAREAHGGVEISMDGGATWPIWVPGWQVERDKAMEAKRAAAYDPSTDYEGEDTRAIDGAGVRFDVGADAVYKGMDAWSSPADPPAPDSDAWNCAAKHVNTEEPRPCEPPPGWSVTCTGEKWWWWWSPPQRGGAVDVHTGGTRELAVAKCWDDYRGHR